MEDYFKLTIKKLQRERKEYDKFIDDLDSLWGRLTGDDKLTVEKALFYLQAPKYTITTNDPAEFEDMVVGTHIRDKLEYLYHEVFKPMTKWKEDITDKEWEYAEELSEKLSKHFEGLERKDYY